MRTVSGVGEFALIQRIARRTKPARPLVRGIGDDAAVLAGGRGLRLLTTDLLVEGVDFSFRTSSAREVGHKALAVNLSDVAAMGGKTEAALVGLAIPKSTKLRSVDDFYDGFLRLAKRFGVQLAGGDLSRSPCWMIAVCVLGRVTGRRPIFRSGARAGDFICVTGELGGSILGKHKRFLPRVKEGEFLSRA
jgi:thiamine-monophosphate kinase